MVANQEYGIYFLMCYQDLSGIKNLASKKLKKGE